MSESVRVEKHDDGSMAYYKRWEEEGLHHSIEVEKVDGGYIITKSKHGTEKDSDKYIDESTKEVSTTNPFEKKDDDGDKLFGIFDNIDIG